MSVLVRPYRRGGWEVDIRLVLPDDSRTPRAPEGARIHEDRGATMGRSTGA